MIKSAEREWEQARQKTLEHWFEVRNSIEKADSVQLIQAINTVSELCEQANQIADGRWGRCDYCLASQQFGGCSGFSLEMTECVVESRWTELRQMVDEFIARVENLEIPPDSRQAS